MDRRTGRGACRPDGDAASDAGPGTPARRDMAPSTDRRPGFPVRLPVLQGVERDPFLISPITATTQPPFATDEANDGHG